MRLFAGAADVLIVAGGLVAATGLVLTFTLSESSSETVSAQAILTPGGGALVTMGRF